ncbi:tetratricopeptide repeat protein [Helicobacter cetorum]|uniref:Uncharacterized protein n=1 Tax=Helicobacter cetorum (strain ATCC BAA-429 / MIT 00-7128) TaxID=182217 RepID=I0EP58_HELC0|nr:tetratricopeptide repeat protein [Helicobacter cetorum]AFI04727.1 hypothetical protein HCW_07345 [Helicobacter cetorum MIT 00-7128]
MGLETITLANIYEEQGFYNEALKVYEGILKKNPNHTQALENLERLKEKIAFEKKDDNEENIVECSIKEDEEKQDIKAPNDSSINLERFILNFKSGKDLKDLEEWLVKWN